MSVMEVGWVEFQLRGVCVLKRVATVATHALRWRSSFSESRSLESSDHRFF